jgi:uncharacterized protein
MTLSNPLALPLGTALSTPAVTLVIAGLCAALYFGMTVAVIARRIRVGVRFGHGQDERLLHLVRVHGNLTECAPLLLLLMALTELAGLPRPWLWLAGGVFVAGRAIHALGLLHPRWHWGRQIGMVATLLAISGLGAASLRLGFAAA